MLLRHKEMPELGLFPLTRLGAGLNNRSVRKTPVLPAALLAATFALALPGPTEARSKGKAPDGPSPPDHGQGARPQGAVEDHAGKSPRPGSDAGGDQARGGPAAPRPFDDTRLRGPRRPGRLRPLEGRIREINGPFLPRETHDYPGFPARPRRSGDRGAPRARRDPLETPEPRSPASTVLPPGSPASPSGSDRFPAEIRGGEVKPQDVDLAELLAGGLQSPSRGSTREDAATPSSRPAEARPHLAIETARREHPGRGHGGRGDPRSREARGGISSIRRTPRDASSSSTATSRATRRTRGGADRRARRGHRLLGSKRAGHGGRTCTSPSRASRGRRQLPGGAGDQPLPAVPGGSAVPRGI